MSIGLIALLDDIAGLAKVAAASLDDVAAQAAKAGAKAAGVVIDDAAVTPRYVVGFAASRELPIVGRIALGSLKNKLIYLLPAALVLSFVAPWAITPLLMIGGAYLCYEGSEKVFEALFPHGAHEHEAAVGAATQTAQSFEDEKVRGAIKTDFILSAEIMAITLASRARRLVLDAGRGARRRRHRHHGPGLWRRGADREGGRCRPGARRQRQAGLEPPAPRRCERPAAHGPALAPLTQGFGRGLVHAMPILLQVLGIVGTAAMIWVGGGIIIHGLEGYGFAGLAHVIHDIAAAAGHAVPSLGSAVEWLVSAAAAGLFGLILGAILIPLTHYVAVPVAKALRGGSRKAEKHTV